MAGFLSKKYFGLIYGHSLGVFLLLPVFFNAWGRKKSIKSHRIGKIVARTHEVNEVKCFYVFPSLLEKKKEERTKKREKKDLIAGFTCRQEP